MARQIKGGSRLELESKNDPSVTNALRKGSDTSDAITSVIVVMFNSGATIQECLHSIPQECDIVLVDQSSSDNGVAVAQQVRPDALVIKAGANRGFAAGCNLGAANAIGDVLIFLNPDAYFVTPECVQVLSDVTRSTNSLVGPRVLDAAGHEQTRARYWSSIRSEIGEVFLPEKWAIGSLRRDIPKDDAVYTLGGPVPYIQGSCMAICADTFWQVYGFDERLFLYREEETLALSLQEIGVNAILEPRVAICHTGATSTSQFRDFAACQYYRSLSLFFSTRYSRPVAAMAIGALWFTLITMAMLAPIRQWTGPRRLNGSRWYRAAAAGAISGWRGKFVEPPRPT